jgi:CheY-like chemotaxis protein
MNPSSAPLMNSRTRILIVHDDPVALRNTGRIAAAAAGSSEIRATGSAVEAAAWLRTESFTVILCNLKMPVYDGLVLLRMARRHTPDALTILLADPMEADALQDGHNDEILWRVLVAPWTEDALLRLLHEALLRARTIQLQRSILKSMAASAGVGKPGGAPLPGLPAGKRMKAGKRLSGAGKAPGPAAAKQDLALQRIRQMTRPGLGAAPVLGRRYRLDRKIKEGEGIELYQAFDLLLEMPVAVKILPKVVATRKNSLDALKREARIAMQLSHNHIVRLHNLEMYNGRYCLAMEYIDGVTLREWISAHGPLNAGQVAQVIRASADALSYAHRRGVFHRDLKPDNIMIRRDGVLKLIDFGIAAHHRKDAGQSPVIEGTPFYMSPEEIAGGVIDRRTDVYSLGVTTHELLTGLLPFASEPDTPGEVRCRAAVLSPALPEPVRRVIARALQPDPEQRWDDVDAFALALQQALLPAASA